MRLILPLLFILASLSVAKAQVPDTDIVLIATFFEEGNMHYEEMHNITDREGYDNQPYFSRGGRSIFYSSATEGFQADIYRYNQQSGKKERITQTPESEYSPMGMPDGRHLSVVRIDMDGTQRLYSIKPDGSNATQIILTTDTIGYYVWIDAERVAIFALGEPFTLRILHVENQTSRTVASNIGRSLAMIPDTKLISFVDKSDSTWVLKSYDPDTDKQKNIVAMPDSTEDYTWLSDGRVLAGYNGKVLIFDPEKDKKWRMAFDLSGTIAENFYRLAVSPTGGLMAVVIFRGTKP